MLQPDDDRLVGQLGYVTTSIGGLDHPGEVQLALRGATESFIAYCSEEVHRGQRVLVLGRRPGRGLDVTPFSD